MKFAARINSFLFQTQETVIDAIEQCKKIEGLTHLEFNYPEHFKDNKTEDIKAHFGRLKVNGVATRFRDEFIGGEFSNRDPEIRTKAVKLGKDAVDACRILGGDTVTIWQSYDGFDYPFQLDYEKAWDKILSAIGEIADYAKDIKISIEYKPFEPRGTAAFDSIGTTLSAIKEMNRKNIGVTLDFCHMLMKHDSPAYALVQAAHMNALYGLHLNDGDSFMDNGLIFGTVNTSRAFEFVYYLKKYKYDGVIFFDTFPVREKAADEIQANIEMLTAIDNAIDRVGLEVIEQTINRQDGAAVQQLIRSLMKNM
jgi:xylose isomerase